MPPSAQQHKCRSSIRNSHSSNIKAMVVPAAAAPECGRREEAVAAAVVFCRRGRGVVVPTVDMSAPAGRGELSRQVARACAGSGFFRAVNHGVPLRVSAAMDAAAAAFFARAGAEKQLAGPPDPLGYGSRSIGANGDVGELEYLILHASPDAVARKASAIDREDPRRFSQVVNDYVEAVRQLACHVLDLLGEGLGLRDPTSLTRLITATDNDSLIRINHYPPSCAAAAGDSVWVPVPPDPSAFFVNPRLSTIYFAAPPLHARISALPETVAAGAPRRYRAFTWAEYKRTMYTLRLSHNRLDLFHAGDGDGDAGVGDDDDHE
uniref:Non-haem dioxygenase N-terminal domain-containing protein n=1 Tax=Oryza barthii TaxID=65489 RepID=A0A0D3ENB5_9ORYZ